MIPLIIQDQFYTIQNLQRSTFVCCFLQHTSSRHITLLNRISRPLNVGILDLTELIFRNTGKLRKGLKHMVQTMRKIFSNFVCFSESPNFISAYSFRGNYSFLKGENVEIFILFWHYVIFLLHKLNT